MRSIKTSSVQSSTRKVSTFSKPKPRRAAFRFFRKKPTQESLRVEEIEVLSQRLEGLYEQGRYQELVELGHQKLRGKLGAPFWKKREAPLILAISLLGSAHLHLRNFESADRYFQETIALPKIFVSTMNKRTYPLWALGDYFLETENWDMVEVIAKQAIGLEEERIASSRRKIKPNNPIFELLEILGENQRRQEKWSEVESTYRKTLDLLGKTKRKKNLIALYDRSFIRLIYSWFMQGKSAGLGSILKMDRYFYWERNKEKLIEFLISLAKIAVHRQNFKQVKYIGKIALTYCQAFPVIPPLYISGHFFHLVAILIKNGEEQLALPFLREGFRIYDRWKFQDDKEDAWSVRITHAVLEFKYGDSRLGHDLLKTLYSQISSPDTNIHLEMFKLSVQACGLQSEFPDLFH